MITETWLIEQLEVYPELSGRYQVVARVQWCQTIDTPGAVHHNHGWTLLPLPQDHFTPYSDLTEAQVLQWAQLGITAHDLNRYSASAADQISALSGITSEVSDLPWSSQ